MGRKLEGIVVAMLAAACLWSPAVAAQGEDFDPEYDDVEAAGPANPDDAPIGGAVEATAAASTETGIDAAAAGTTGADKPDAKERAKRRPWEMNTPRHHSTLSGSTGLLYLPEAGSDEAGTFGLGVHGTYFKYHDYLYKGDEASAMWGAIALRVTPLEFLEVYGSLASSAMHNSKGDPKLFQSFGDLNLGAKGYYSFLDDFLTVGGNVGVFFYNPIGDVGATFDGTSVALDALATLDFGALRSFLPGRLHVGLGYVFDNSAKVIEGLEQSGGGCGQDRDGDGLVEYEGCLTPDERTALGIDRNDQFRIRTGIDVLLPYVSPILEYKLEVPVNRQDFVCPKDTPASLDQCMAQRGSAGFRQVLTIGARVLPPMDSLAIDIGVDIGLSGYGPSVHELAAEAPWRLVFGASYSFDPFPEVEAPPPPPPVILEAAPPPEPPAVVAGFVHDAADPMIAVRGAIVSYAGHDDLNPQVTGIDGKFRSYPLPIGPVTVFVKADGYEETTFTVELPATGQVALDCPLKAMAKRGELAIHVRGDQSAPLAGATLSITGPENLSPTTDANGAADGQLLEGSYRIRAEKEGYLQKVTEVTVAKGKKLSVDIQLSPKPKTTLIERRKDMITIKKQIHFANDSDEIKSESFGLLDEIADLLISSPEIKRVEIQGHTDNRGAKDYNVDLSERRARAIRLYLVTAGVESSRLEAKGYGPEKPIAPNVTGQGRARNRRVEFHILEQN